MADRPAPPAIAAVSEIAVHDSLTIRTTGLMCRLVLDRLEAGAPGVLLDLEGVRRIDVVGLAALHQAARRAVAHGTAFSVIPSAAVRRGLIEGRLGDEIPLTDGRAGPRPPVAAHADVRGLADSGDAVLTTSRLSLHPPARRDLGWLERWARDPLLGRMVGSELLYHCRHAGAFEPDFVARVFAAPTELTLLVQPHESPAAPVGFVRLYDVRLGEHRAGLETVIADPRSVRRGWGVEASRLFLAFARDVLEVRRVEAKVYVDNLLSTNALRRNGFRQEGVLRGVRPCRETQREILLYSILEEEMDEQRRRERFPPMGLWEASGAVPPSSDPVNESRERGAPRLGMGAPSVGGV